MTIRGLVFDVSGTLLDRTNSQVDGVAAVLDAFANEGITLIAAVNETSATATSMLRRGGLLGRFDHLVTRTDVGVAKGSPKWTNVIQETAQLAAQNMAYVGDSQRDMVTALRGPMLYFHAAWADATPNRYGFRAQTPEWFRRVVFRILRKEYAWYWQSGLSANWSQSVNIRALVLAGDLLDQPLRDQLLRLLKDNTDTRISADMTLHEFVSLHLITSLFHDDLFNMDLWTCVPGHTGHPNATLEPTLRLAANLNGSPYKANLLVRDRATKRSRESFRQGGSHSAIRDQLNSLSVDAGQHVDGKRILVLDNYLTHGSTAEAVRSLLYQAGAAQVVTVAVGKYPSPPMSMRGDVVVCGAAPPFESLVAVSGTANAAALQFFLDGYLQYVND